MNNIFVNAIIVCIAEQHLIETLDEKSKCSNEQKRLLELKEREIGRLRCAVENLNCRLAEQRAIGAETSAETKNVDLSTYE